MLIQPNRALRFTSAVLVLLLAVSCADANRDNSVDPVNTPIVRLATPVFDAGTILLEWRYYSEGDDLTQFEITRSSEGESTTIGVIPVASVDDGWQTVSLRDTVFVAGVDVEYRVLALDRGGVITASSSGSIKIGGTILNRVRDPINVRIRFTWSDEPPGTTGYELLRNGEVIFRTDDPSVRAFDDTDITAKVVYTYELRTLLAGGREIVSDALVGLLMSVSNLTPPDPSTPPAAGYLIPKGSHTLSALALTASDYHAILYLGLQNIGIPYRIVLPDSDSGTWSTATLKHTNLQFSTVVAGLTDGDSSVFLSAFPNVSTDNLLAEPLVAKSWPSTGGSKTGVVWAGPEGFGSTLVYAGTTLYVLDNDFEIVHEIQIDTGEPEDIDFQAGSVWLAYPDRLVRSNDTFLTEGVTSWNTVTTPSDITISAITTYWEDKLVVFDRVASRLHVFSLEGEALLSWDAEGQDADRGDVAFYRPPIGSPRIHQTDGRGFLHTFDPIGSNIR